MTATMTENAKVAENRKEVIDEAHHEKWAHFPINWSAVWVGALSCLAAVVLFSIIGTALGAHLATPEQRITDRVVDIKNIGHLALGYAVLTAFLTFVIGGYVAGKIAGILHSEPAVVHGAIVWLVATPLLVLLTAIGAGSTLGGWYAGMSGKTASAPYEKPEPLGTNYTEAERSKYYTDLAEYNRQVKQWHDETPRATRNAALGVATVLLLGLMGSVVGGWMSTGEPMTFTYRRTRPLARSIRV